MRTPLLNQELIGKMAKFRLLGKTSCLNCVYAYTSDTGYSNWTVEGTEFVCAQDRNPNLPAEIPWDIKVYSDGQDPWDKTKNSRCELYEQLPEPPEYIHLDVDNEENSVPSNYPAEPLAVIAEHCGRKL